MQPKSCQIAIIGSLFAAIVLSGCLTRYLEENAARMDAQMKEQSTEIAQQRKAIEALSAGQTLSDTKKLECERAFREYFDKAQISTNRDQAIDLYQKGLGICPDDDVAHYELGRALANAGRYGEAEKEFETALKINPGFVDAKSQLELVRNRK